ncbi:hypothetical protein HUB98_24155 [Paenibacillus barcinonensis]|uniref:Uncharacterized protein n=1 Tax=Paenibacillus barcinonensis TaxID=198119 RepID=A0A2V4UPD4_PAEBA|nr:hypothetical protein [Paenibacillus barcinonensis]PYE42097.1 hypothetical protein DFQ00_1452 [Paenibacillus barcinonensis]QKS58996.1 hypothetical protein HUB98_24155 [Paenibacillus barcinonensis]
MNLEDQKVLFNIFHDGTLFEIIEDDGDYLITIEIQYLAERVKVVFDLFHIQLRKPNGIFFKDSESDRVVDDVSKIKEMELEILHTELKEERISIFCGNEENNNYGFLMIEAEDIQIFDQEHKDLELNELKKMTQDYWNEFKQD